ncbi:spermine oxidase [Manduca sexta]|uniref:spermine oxidase n=1 Tax=Manduca sexta TaxID=7130 RepID=UPI0018905E9B|nr:spermine oxidase [Manduca sexta]
MDVIVIGCGASGLAAIRKLHDAGLQVLGLEAATRIGGRILTVEYCNGTVDLGAAWCHGEKNNIVFELAEPLGLLGKPDDYENYFMISNGELVPRDVCEEIISVLENEVYEADKNTKSISECVQGAINNHEILQKEPHITNWLTAIYEKLNHLGGEDDPKTGKSLRSLEESHICEGEFMLNWKDKGFKALLSVLLNQYPDPSKEIPVQILRNKEVTNVRWRTSQPGDTTNPLVQVKCKDGSLYAAKSVIITVSVGVLKERHANLFNPPLPKEKLNCINNMQMCILDKIYIEFTKPWWSKACKYQLLWREEDKAQFSDQDRWIAEIFCLETVEYQPNLLRAWMYGKAAAFMEKLSNDEVKTGVNVLLERVLKKRFDVTPVKSVLRSKWGSNPLTRGAYAYRSVTTEENGGGAAILSEPLFHDNGFPVVCFGGEATSHHYHPNVHGAVEAGFREAERLVESFKKL